MIQWSEIKTNKISLNNIKVEQVLEKSTRVSQNCSKNKPGVLFEVMLLGHFLSRIRLYRYQPNEVYK